MNKKQLVAHVADTTGVAKKDVLAVLNALTDTVQDTLASGDDVVLVGFGRFSRRLTKARDGRNPLNGQTVHIPAKHKVFFKAGKDFSTKLNPTT